MTKHSHYFKPVAGLQHVDVYRVLRLFEVTDPCLQHAIKKLLVAGGRGAKEISQDVQEAIDTLDRWKAMRQEDERAGSVAEAFDRLAGKPILKGVSGPFWPHMKTPAGEQSMKWQASIEPASAIDDDSPRQQLIQQSGEMAEHVYPAVDAAKEPRRPRHLCATCGGGHALHNCGLGGER